MHLPSPARVRLIGFALAVLVGGGVVWLLFGSDLDAVREVIEDSGAWGPVVYVALHVVLTLVPVSRNVLALAAGALFGLGAGIALAWLGAVVSAVVTYVLARRIGRQAVVEMTGDRIRQVDELLGDEGFNAVVMGRLTPVLPFTVLNYGAGVSSVTGRPYLLGSMVGLVPGALGYAALGASAGQDARTYVIAVVVSVLMFAVSFLAARSGIRRRRAA